MKIKPARPGALHQFFLHGLEFGSPSGNNLNVHTDYNYMRHSKFELERLNAGLGHERLV
jgi:hypothetical protein